MLINNPQFDNFKFALSDDFFVKSKTEKFDNWLKLKPRYVSEITDAINETIQTISFPGFGFDPIVQQQPATTKGAVNEVSFTPNVSFGSLVTDNIFSITFAHVEGFINYFSMLEHFYHYASNGEGDDTFAPIPNQYVEVLDAWGNLLFVFHLKRILFIGMDGLELSRNKVEQEFDTFECRFKYDDYELQFNVPEMKTSHDK